MSLEANPDLRIIKDTESYSSIKTAIYMLQPYNKYGSLSCIFSVYAYWYRIFKKNFKGLQIQSHH